MSHVLSLAHCFSRITPHTQPHYCPALSQRFVCPNCATINAVIRLQVRMMTRVKTCPLLFVVAVV